MTSVSATTPSTSNSNLPSSSYPNGISRPSYPSSNGPASPTRSYDFEDPWNTSSVKEALGRIQHGGAPSARTGGGDMNNNQVRIRAGFDSRPITWGGQGSGLVPRVAGQAHSRTNSNATQAGGGELPPSIYRTAWEVASSSSSSSTFIDQADPRVGSDDGAAAVAISAETEISLGQLHRVLTVAGGLGAGNSEKIINLSCSRPKCSRSEFYLAMALLAQCQAGKGFDIKKASEQIEDPESPGPRLDLSELSSSPSNIHTFPPPATTYSTRPPGLNREMSDPWYSSSSGDSNGIGAQSSSAGPSDGLPNAGPGGGISAAFKGLGSRPLSPTVAERSRLVGGLGAAGYRGSFIEEGEEEAGFISAPGLGSSRFLDGPATLGQPSTASRMRSMQTASYLPDGGEGLSIGAADDPAATLPVDQVSVRLRAELEGFIIKHNVYVVSSRIRASSVVRRYSDWVWLAECLVKRYPFRCLPVLPPKRLSIPVAGKHLSADDHFVERRRRGLERYLKALSCHPVLSKDKLVEVFFTEKQALSDWRQSAPPLYLDEEGMTKVLDEVEQMSIPEDLDAKLLQQRKAVPELVERWSGIVALFERMVKRNDAAAADYSRLNFSLLSLVESSSKRWRPESDRRMVTEEVLGRLAECSQEHADLISARASAASITTLENLKYQRDLILSFRDLLIRLDRLLPDNVDGLKRRIELSTKRATTVRREERPNWEAEYEKLIASIGADTSQVEKLTNRRVHAKKCCWDEMVWFFWRYREVESVCKAWVKSQASESLEVSRKWEVLDLKLDSFH
ncbi:hypothetical protein IE53DRAFT_386551 [Violaceomyces palustris]|uniref:Uncharacterized protein n=1 Tax=Violaceomyces palustris TaxID=1673888 RepID=A0ACD0NZ45_9BASI|nr:hypothetical protein IE53DRAFT_386551 [Violaceomyces palustris]